MVLCTSSICKTSPREGCNFHVTCYFDNTTVEKQYEHQCALLQKLEYPSLETAWKCTCAQASAQFVCAPFVHSVCSSLDIPCTLELLLGHSLYTGGVYMLWHSLGICVHFQAVSKLGQSLQLLQQWCCLSDKLLLFQNTFKLCFGSAIVLLLQTAFECTGESASTMYLVYKLMHILHTCDYS